MPPAVYRHSYAIGLRLPIDVPPARVCTTPRSTRRSRTRVPRDRPRAPVEQLALQRAEEGLHHRVVVRRADAPHRVEQARCAQTVPEGPRGVPGAAVGVQHGAPRRRRPAPGIWRIRLRFVCPLATRRTMIRSMSYWIAMRRTSRGAARSRCERWHRSDRCPSNLQWFGRCSV